jgi:hypothetical protein
MAQAMVIQGRKIMDGEIALIRDLPNSSDFILLR